MNPSSVAIASSQIFFMWILMGLLVAWMVTFAVLALRPGKTKNVELEEFNVVYGSTSVPSAPSLMHIEVR